MASPSPTQVKILVPGNHLMVGLLGQRDELLRLVEGSFPVEIHVRGNEITVTGDASEAERVGRLFEEMVILLEQGHSLDREGVGRSIEMLKADQRPTDVLHDRGRCGAARPCGRRPRARRSTSTPCATTR